MSQKVKDAMAADIVVGDGYIIRFHAVSPTTGADVSGVTVSNVNIDADDQTGGAVQVSNPILIGTSV